MAHSLKDKRGVLKGTIQKLARKFNVSIAEVDGNDSWNKATLGVSCVSNEKRIVESTIRRMLDEIEMVDGLELDSHEEEYY
jgi:uncharacterized protein YlxP (DUF503 family)